MTMEFKIDHSRDYQGTGFQIMNVGANSGGDAYLLLTEHSAALIDSGFSFCARQMINNIQGALDGRSLDYILLTHSHYDHASGSALCRQHFTDVKVAASAYTAKVFAKPTAVALMRKMNAAVAPDYGFHAPEDLQEALCVDIELTPGDEIVLGDMNLQVLDAAGHTNCSIAFYAPRERLLLSAETPGSYVSDGLIAPCYLVSYEKTMDFIRRAQGLDVDKLLIPHFGVLTGKACKRYLTDALSANEALKDFIVGDYKKGKTQLEIIDHYRSVYYNNALQAIQPIAAFNLNAGFLVSMIINECAGRELSVQ